MTTAKQIIHDLGKVTKVSAALGLPYTTVDGWARHNSIPPWRWPDILALAAKNGIAIASDARPAGRRADAALQEQAAA